jgi:hypothetical protein
MASPMIIQILAAARKLDVIYICHIYIYIYINTAEINLCLWLVNWKDAGGKKNNYCVMLLSSVCVRKPAVTSEKTTIFRIYYHVK